MDAHSVAASYLGAACLVLISFLPVLWLRASGEPARVWAAFGIVVLALHALSFINVFGGTLPGAQWDAQTFHEQALKYAESGGWPAVSMGTKFYEYILAAAYKLFGPGLLVGQSLSVVAAAVTLLAINAAAANLGVRDPGARAGIVLVSGLYPTFLYHNALTFREPYELLGLVLGVLFVLKTFQEFKWKWVAGVVLSLLFMGLFHHVLLGIGVLLICWFVVILYGPRLQSGRSYAAVAALIVLTAGLGYAAITNIPITLENDYIKEIRKERGIVEAIVQYRESIESVNPRTSFGTSFDTDSGARIAGSAAVNYWHYLSRPFVTELEWTADAVPFASSVARLALLLGFLVLALSRGFFKRELAFCLGAYLVVTGVWSLGTTNYGQAFRHHALTDWLLVLMAGYALHLAWSTRSAAGESLERTR